VSVLIERLSAKDYLAQDNLTYVDVFKLHDLYDKMAYRANLILVGPKGIGKTLSVASYAALRNVPIITYDCSEDVRRSNLIGMYVLRGNETPFVLGPLTTAFEVANEFGSCILALEEFSALTPTMQKIINSVSDFRKSVVVPECGKIFKLNSGAKLWIVGTMNFAIYGGVYALNEDLKSRFRMLELNYPEPKAEREIVAAVLKGMLTEKNKPVLDSVLTLAHETRQKALEYALSTRDVVQIVEDVTYLGPEQALRVALGKFEGDDKATVIERISSIFGIRLR
jgi:nitric oxide reductase NorQ protein